MNSIPPVSVVGATDRCVNECSNTACATAPEHADRRSEGGLQWSIIDTDIPA
jgi:hypothetical protein